LIADALSANQLEVAAFYQAQQSQAAIFAKAYAQIADRTELAGLFARWDPDELRQLRSRMLTQRSTEDILCDPDGQRFHLKGGNDRFVRRGKDLSVWGAQGPALKAEIQAFGIALGGLITACDERLLVARNQALWACASSLGQCLEEVMAKSHEIDFTGLEMKAWELLGGELAADFHARFDRQISQLLVDEFQDTNPVQWAMLRGWLSYEQDDHNIAASAPRVFIVGDPKQSIYRFRRADPEVFYAASRWLAQHFDADMLSTNTTYRCGPAVVRFLNAALGSAASNRFTDHETRATDATGFVARLALASDWESEGRAIASALLQIRTELPHLQWSDVRILLRARTHFQSYELALTEAGIPFVSDRTGGLLSSPEIADLIALLRFLAAPWSDRDCAQALKSPIFGLSDQQLVAIAGQRVTDGLGSFYAGLQ
jgi:ATP-dependent helicase/nuclease subunit A